MENYRKWFVLEWFVVQWIVRNYVIKTSRLGYWNNENERKIVTVNGEMVRNSRVRLFIYLFEFFSCWINVYFSFLSVWFEDQKPIRNSLPMLMSSCIDNEFYHSLNAYHQPKSTYQVSKHNINWSQIIFDQYSFFCDLVGYLDTQNVSVASD